METLQGRQWRVTVTEAEPVRILEDPALDDLLAQECDGHDPYLRTTLAENRGRALLAEVDGGICGLAALQPAAAGPQLEVVALGVNPARLGALMIESLIAASRRVARRRDSELHVLLPPHADFTALVIEQLGFERRGADRHGRARFVDVAVDGMSGIHAHWMLHLEPAAHAALLPEVGGLAQQHLFEGGDATAGAHSLGIRRQAALPRQSRDPVPGDLIFTMHGRADSLAASRALTAVLAVEGVIHCDDPVDLKVTMARRGSLQAAEIPALLSGGSATVLTLRMLGRLEHPVPFARLKQVGLVRSLPHALRRLEPTAVARIAPSLKLV
jgi:N-acetylglutamate synthase-like GNAT family acetyltransferase